jgi:hypothetical protein
VGAAALEGGPWGLIALGVLSIWRGWWIPARMHEARIADLLARVEDHKAAAAAWQRVAAERQEQIAILLGRVKEPL